MTVGLPVARLIDVTVNLSPSGATLPSVTSSLAIGSSSVIDVSERWREYADIDEVSADFGTDTPEYFDAVDYFDQSPKPQQLFIGRWAQAATAGILYCGDLTPTQQIIATWNAITTGSFHITEDGNAAISVTACDFSASGNLNAVATEINTCLAAAMATATCAWNGSQFVFISGTTGATSSVAFLTAGAGGVDIHSMLAGTAATGATEVNGIVAESALTALTIIENMLAFYMLRYSSPSIVQSDILAIAAYVEADATPHIYSITVQDAEALNPESTEDIGYQLNQLQYQRTNYQYSSTSAYAIASFQGRAATVDFSAASSAITLAYKTEPGIDPEILTSSQASALDAKQYSYYATFNGIPIIVNGFMAKTNFYFDDVQNSDWMVAQIQTDLFNVLYQTPTKIPQTDPGVHVLTTTVSKSLGLGVNNGVIGPGVWEFDGFGTLSTGDYLETGYYVWANSVASQTPSQRATRTSPTIQAAVIFAGAVQTVGILVNVQR